MKATFKTIVRDALLWIHRIKIRIDTMKTTSQRLYHITRGEPAAGVTLLRFLLLYPHRDFSQGFDTMVTNTSGT